MILSINTIHYYENAFHNSDYILSIKFYKLSIKESNNSQRFKKLPCSILLIRDINEHLEKFWTQLVIL